MPGLTKHRRQSPAVCVFRLGLGPLHSHQVELHTLCSSLPTLGSVWDFPGERDIIVFAGYVQCNRMRILWLKRVNIVWVGECLGDGGMLKTVGNGFVISLHCSLLYFQSMHENTEQPVNSQPCVVVIMNIVAYCNRVFYCTWGMRGAW